MSETLQKPQHNRWQIIQLVLHLVLLVALIASMIITLTGGASCRDKDAMLRQLDQLTTRLSEQDLRVQQLERQLAEVKAGQLHGEDMARRSYSALAGLVESLKPLMAPEAPRPAAEPAKPATEESKALTGSETPQVIDDRATATDTDEQVVAAEAPITPDTPEDGQDKAVADQTTPTGQKADGPSQELNADTPADATPAPDTTISAPGGEAADAEVTIQSAPADDSDSTVSAALEKSADDNTAAQDEKPATEHSGDAPAE